MPPLEIWFERFEENELDNATNPEEQEQEEQEEEKRRSTVDSMSVWII